MSGVAFVPSSRHPLVAALFAERYIQDWDVIDESDERSVEFFLETRERETVYAFLREVRGLLAPDTPDEVLTTMWHCGNVSFSHVSAQGRDGARAWLTTVERTAMDCIRRWYGDDAPA